MRTTVIAALATVAVIAGGCNRSQHTAPATGPSGGDVVPIKDGAGYAEFLANAETGEVMVHTWDRDLKTRLPVESEPMTVGSGGNKAELMPHPADGDPPGRCSRFYAHADWVRGGSVRDGWMHGGAVGDHRDFTWRHCWEGGRAHGRMWEEMGPHRRMGPGHGGPMGPGHHGGKGP